MLGLLAVPLLLLAQEPKAESPILPRLEAMSKRVEQPEELGQIRWGRDFEAGLAQAQRTRRPLLLLFQEVPG